MLKQQNKPKGKRMVSLKDAVCLLGVRLTKADFEGDKASPGQLKALAAFRVNAPAKTPFHVAWNTIQKLSERANDPRNLAALWQLAKLAGEYGHRPSELRDLTYPEAMVLIDAEKSGGL